MGKGSKRRPENQKAYRDAYSKVLGWDDHPLGALSRLESKRKRRDPDHLEMLIDRLDASED